jgi:hypothetical protein
MTKSQQFIQRTIDLTPHFDIIAAENWPLGWRVGQPCHPMHSVRDTQVKGLFAEKSLAPTPRL